MRELRDIDVHTADIPTTTKEKAIPAYSGGTMGSDGVIGSGGAIGFMAVNAPVDAMVPNPDPHGTPAAAPAWIMRTEIYLDGVAAGEMCERFLDLAERLIAKFRDDV